MTAADGGGHGVNENINRLLNKKVNVILCEVGVGPVTAPEARTMTSAVAKRLDALRRKGAMKNIEVASLIGTRPETVSRWNQGRAYPHAATEKTLLELEYT